MPSRAEPASPSPASSSGRVPRERSHARVTLYPIPDRSQTRESSVISEVQQPSAPAPAQELLPPEVLQSSAPAPARERVSPEVLQSSAPAPVLERVSPQCCSIRLLRPLKGKSTRSCSFTGIMQKSGANSAFE
ncbi:hypothetical protein PC123_g23575 [Phytophthora cactorum]|nr:hypothetical protein PC120_g22957 [Phytophthora cactorum]KAG4040893.1 hypothetical protein PC123_g23575 [Phytophthora cactorum]